MLFPSESFRKAIDKRLKAFGKEKDPVKTANELLEIDPHFGPAYLILGTAALEAGRMDEAEQHFWNGLAEHPLAYDFYEALSDVRIHRDPSAELSLDLAELAYRKLWATPSIAPHVSKKYNELMGSKLGVDFNDPAAFGALAHGLEQARKTPVNERLRPYWQLDRLQEQAEDELDEDLLGQILQAAPEMVPVLISALRQWARHAEAAQSAAISLVLAILGEIAPPDTLDYLIDAAMLDEEEIFLHANWAVCRMGQRFPEETVARFLARTPAEAAATRCSFAEQLALMPRRESALPAAHALLSDFKKMARGQEAVYLLAAAAHAIEIHGSAEEASAAVESLSPLLTAADRRALENWRAKGFDPRLRSEGLHEFSLDDVCLDRVLSLELDEEGEEEMDDEETDLLERAAAAVVEAPPKPKPPGRNEPCWCGSGKKYKKCHLGEDESKQHAAALENAMYGRLFEDLVTASRGWDGPEEAGALEALRLYFAEDAKPPDDDYGFGKWLICNFRAGGDDAAETTLERYLRERGTGVTSRERALLESWRDGRYGVFEVQRVEPGRGVELHNLFTKELMFVVDVTSSKTLSRRDCLLGRVEFFEGKWELGGNGMHVPRPCLTAVLQQVESEARAAGLTEGEWSHRYHYRLGSTVRNWYAQRALPTIQNAEGDLFEFCSAKYEILNEAAVLAGLGMCREFESEKPPAPQPGEEAAVAGFAWLGGKPGSDVRRSYGRLEVRPGLLRLECNSRNRLDRGKELINKHAGKYVRHQGDRFKSVDEAMKDRP